MCGLTRDDATTKVDAVVGSWGEGSDSSRVLQLAAIGWNGGAVDAEGARRSTLGLAEEVGIACVASASGLVVVAGFAAVSSGGLAVAGCGNQNVAL